MNREKPLAVWAPFGFLLWVTFLLIVTHRASLAVLPEGLDFLRDAVIPKLFIGKNFVPFWSNHLLLMAKAVCLMAGGWGIGRGLQRCLCGADRSADSSGLLRDMLLPAALGLGVMGYLAFLVLAVGFHALALLGFAAAAISIAGAGVLFEWLRRSLSIKRRESPLASKDRDFLPVLLMAVVVIAMGMSLILSTTPEINFDSLEYHLAIPQAYLQAGRIIDLPYNIFSKLPLLMSMLYVWALTIGGSAVDGMYIAKWINFFLGVGVVMAVYAWGKRLNGTRAGILAALLFCSLPMVFYFSMTATADMACLFFVAATVSAFALWAHRRDTPLLWIAGLLGGFALATKYVAGFALAPLWIWLAGEAWRRETRAGGSLLLFTLLLLLPLLPWWTQNLLLGYNPLFPLIGVPAFESIRRITHLFGPLREVLTYSLVYYPDPARWIGPLFLAAVPLVLLGVRDRRVRLGALYCLVGLSVGSIVTANIRYFAALLPVAAVTIALATERLEPARSRLICYVGLLAVCSFNIGWSATQLMFFTTDGLAVGAGQVVPADFLKIPRNLYPAPSYGAYEALGRIGLPQGERALIVGETRTFYCPVPFLGGSAYDPSPILEWAEKSKDAEELVAHIDERNVRVIVVNRAEFFRVAQAGKHDLRIENLLVSMSNRYFKKYYEDAFTVVFVRRGR